MGYTTDDLVLSVKTRGMLPDASEGSFSSAAILQIASEELQGPLVQQILSTREKYYETYVETPILAGVDTYALPTRAIGGLLSVPQWIYGKYVTPLTPIEPSEVVTTNQTVAPCGFYFQNNSVVLYPAPSVSQGTLRLRYFQRPSRLEQTINCAKVVSFDTVAKTVTVASIPTSWTTGTVLDFVPSLLPYTPYGLNSSATGVTGTTVSFSSLPAALAVGDWLAIAEFTPIPEVPQEFFMVLVRRTLSSVMESGSDSEKFQIAEAKLKEASESAVKLVTPRDQAGPKKVISNWRYF